MVLPNNLAGTQDIKHLGMKKTIRKNKKVKYVNKQLAQKTLSLINQSTLISKVSTEQISLSKYKWSTSEFPGPMTKYELVGKGSFGTVRRAWSKPHQMEFALKEIHHAYSNSNIIETEYALLKSLDHDNIVKMWGWFRYDVQPEISTVIVMDLYEGDLFDYIKEKYTGKGRKMFPRCLTRSTKYVRELVSAIEYLQEVHKHIHMDLKPENILVSSSDSIKVSDFGCVISMDSPRQIHYQNNGFTNLYAPPEIFDSSGFDSTVDVWAIGIITYEMFHPKGESPIYDQAVLKEAREKNDFTPPKSRLDELCDRNSATYSCLHGQDLQEFLYKILGNARIQRPIISELKHFPWFSTDSRRSGCHG